MLKSFLSLFLQNNCPLCQRATSAEICPYCQRQIESCQHQNPSQFWQEELPLFIWGVYGDRLKQAIATLKYDSQPQLGELMGYWLGKAWVNACLGKKSLQLIVVPVPLHATKIQQRGFNQAELIAKGFCHVTGYSLRGKGIERVKPTEAMFGLNPLQRQDNIRDAFRLGKGWQKHDRSVPILLIDDIYTTGITVREVTKVLRSHNMSVFGVAAIASSKQL